MFNNLHNDDILWVYMICCSEEFCHQNWEEIHDPAFCCLMMIGIIEWDKVNKQLNQTKLVMRFTMAMGSRLMAYILEEEEQVRVSCLIVLR